MNDGYRTAAIAKLNPRDVTHQALGAFPTPIEINGAVMHKWALESY